MINHPEADSGTVLGPERGLRPAEAGDASLLAEAFFDARPFEWATLPAALMEQQHELWRRHLTSSHPEAETWIMSASDGGAIGRLVLDRAAPQHHLIDITVLARQRGSGHGTSALRQIQGWAAAAAAPLTLHVEHHNPARALYLRLGFEEVHRDGLRALLRWRAPTDTRTPGVDSAAAAP